MNENYITTENGKIRISEDVISVISAISAKEVEGLAYMGGNVLGNIGNIGDLLGKKSQGKGVKVEFTETGLIIEVHITVKFGVKIGDVSTAIQEHVKNGVETMAGLNVDAVNVYVDGVDIEKAKTTTDLAE